jgi:hypothetical protein
VDFNTKTALIDILFIASFILMLFFLAWWVCIQVDGPSVAEDSQNPEPEDDSDDGGNMRRKPPPEPPKGPGGCSVQLTKAQKAHDFRLRG